jgi:hypothetical protein
MFAWLSLVLSTCTLILELIVTSVDEEARIHSFVGDDEIYILMGISVILLVLGLVRDIKKDKELYG